MGIIYQLLPLQEYNRLADTHTDCDCFVDARCQLAFAFQKARDFWLANPQDTVRPCPLGSFLKRADELIDAEERSKRDTPSELVSAAINALERVC